MARREFLEVPEPIAAHVRAICNALPETVEQLTGYTGSPRWRIRDATFASLVSEARDGRPITTVTFHARGADLDALLHVGHPFYAGWGGGLIAMVLDDNTDWDEASEVLADSYCVCAPKKLAKLVRGNDTPRL